MMTNKGNYLAAADHDLDCDILQVGGQSLTKMFSQTGTRKQHHKKIKFPFFSSHTQETSACSSPCQGSSLAWGLWSRKSLPRLSISGSKTWQTGQQLRHSIMFFSRGSFKATGLCGKVGKKVQILLRFKTIQLRQTSMSPSGHVRLCYLGLNWSKTMTWLKTWRRWASLACLRRLPISLAWPLKEFPWTGWATLNRWQIILICDPFSHLDILLTARNTSFQSNVQILISLCSWSTKESSLWTKREQKLLLWLRWASCRSPLRFASSSITPSSSWSTSTARTALCSWAGWPIPPRAKQKVVLHS